MLKQAYDMGANAVVGVKPDHRHLRSQRLEMAGFPSRLHGHGCPDLARAQYAAQARYEGRTPRIPRSEAMTVFQSTVALLPWIPS